jgi:hypothetical protein
MTASLLKPRPGVPVRKAFDVEGLLKAKFDELIDSEDDLKTLSKSAQEAIHRILRVANKIGYTNGFKKAATSTKP